MWKLDQFCIFMHSGGDAYTFHLPESLYFIDSFYFAMVLPMKFLYPIKEIIGGLFNYSYHYL